MNNKNYMANSPSEKLTLTELRSYKCSNNEPLHQTVIDFIYANNGGTPERSVFDYVDHLGVADSGDVLEFLPLYRSDKDDIHHVTECFRSKGRIGDNYIVVARESAGNLVLADKETGNVYLWDHEQEGANSKNCYLLENSLDDFFNKSLYSL